MQNTLPPQVMNLILHADCAFFSPEKFDYPVVLPKSCQGAIG